MFVSPSTLRMYAMTLESGSSSSIVTLRDSFLRTGALPVWCKMIVTAGAKKQQRVKG